MTEKPRVGPALIAGAILHIAMGYAAVEANMPKTKIEQVLAEAFALFPGCNREEVAVILSAMQTLAVAATGV